MFDNLVRADQSGQPAGRDLILQTRRVLHNGFNLRFHDHAGWIQANLYDVADAVPMRVESDSLRHN